MKTSPPSKHLQLNRSTDYFSSNRWKWSVGTAAGAALAATADAGTVQITLGDEASNVSGGLPTSTISSDITGDGKADLNSVIASGFKLGGISTSYRLYLRTASGTLASAGWVSNSASSSYFCVYLRGLGKFDPFQQNRSGLLPVNFSDSRINGGALTNAWLEVNARNISNTTHAITLIRLVFDDATTARPGGVAIGQTDPEWVDPTPALRRALLKQQRKLKKKLRSAASRKQAAKVKKLKKQIRKLKKKLKKL